MARAFPPRPECPDIPDIDSIEGSLVDLSQEVSDAPPPAYEFPVFEFPPPNPPGNAFGCYGISISSRLNAGPGNIPIVSSSIDPLFEAVISYPKEADTGVCQPVFDFNIRIPPCATILLDGQVTMDQTVSLPAISISGGRDPDAPCASVFDFDFRIPCNTVNITALVSEVAELEDPEWEVSKNDGVGVCVTDFTLNLRLPPSGGGGGASGVCKARMASVGDMTPSGLQTVDGVVGSADDVVLLKDQTVANTNGAYFMRSGFWERTCSLTGGAVVTVREGDTNGATAWMLTTNNPIIIGVTPLTFELISGAACCCSARVATNFNITLTGLQTVDDIVLAEDETCLVKSQTNQAENGPYLVKTTAWERTCELSSGHTVSVREGSINKQTMWMLMTNNPIEVDTTALSYRQVIDRPTARIGLGANITLSGVPSVRKDGVVLVAGDVVLAFGQTTGSQNGLWQVQTGAWNRVGDITEGMIVTVRQGAVLGGKSLILTTPGPIQIDVTSLSFSLIDKVIAVKAAEDMGPLGVPGFTATGLPTTDTLSTVAGDAILLFNDYTPPYARNGVWAVSGAGQVWDKVIDVTTPNLGTIITTSDLGSRFERGTFVILGGSFKKVQGLTAFVGEG